MATEIKLPSVAEIQEFFFEVALLGYAGGGKFIREHTLLPEKNFTYHDPNKHLLCIDSYRTNGEFSSEEMIIYFMKFGEAIWTPLWSMQYHGWCKVEGKKKYIAFLKERLREAYEKKVFEGGRGYFHNANKKLFYSNEFHGGFEKCFGYEKIDELCDDTQIRNVFWHRYQCLLLFKVEAD